MEAARSAASFMDGGVAVAETVAETVAVAVADTVAVAVAEINPSTITPSMIHPAFRVLAPRSSPAFPIPAPRSAFLRG